MLSATDRALYTAKARGRNCAVGAHELADDRATG
jgi:PleD family two-component response regulator